MERELLIVAFGALVSIGLIGLATIAVTAAP